MSNRVLKEIIALSKYRWCLPILAMLGRRGARFAELLNSLVLPRDSLSRCLEYLIACGWVERNPGHGHPLRPEYLLTQQGQAVSATALRLLDVQQKIEIGPKDMTRWTLPLVLVHADADQRFKDIEAAIPKSSPRALSISLKKMVQQNLLKREIFDDYPPVPKYALSSRGRKLAEAMISG